MKTPRPASRALMNKTWLSRSSGKDSAFAPYELKKDSKFKVAGLLTTVNETHERVAMHAVREELLLRQAGELGLPLCRILPGDVDPCGENGEFHSFVYDSSLFKNASHCG